MKIEADQSACMAYGNCVAVAPDVYDLPDQVVEVILPEIPPELEAAARKGARRCPAKALTVLD
ncbi:ferredoxin [Streptomyces sp. NPDC047043]|uniref:ferredoxin n=1 Tax=unclassified Streptomyces TaxID=2593676 RepID=UPI0033DF2549